MNKREAILAAADFIERNPERYNFLYGGVPGEGEYGGCVTCMWGWIGYFMKLPAGTENSDVARAVTGHTDTGQLYHMRAYYETHSAYDGAKLLRRFAEKFPPELEPAYLAFRDSIKEIDHAETN